MLLNIILQKKQKSSPETISVFFSAITEFFGDLFLTVLFFYVKQIF